MALSLRRLRKRRRLSQRELAELCTLFLENGDVRHLEQTTVSALERGYNVDPKKSTMEALARGLRCSLQEVASGIDQSQREAQHASHRR